MADIFISYAREDRSRIEPLAKSLEELGWTVFWDRTIPTGKAWRQVIGDALKNARSVIVAWSQNSIESDWVQEEADRGRKKNILIPILIDAVDPPLGFGNIQAAGLINWDPAQSSPEFEKLIADISIILGPSPRHKRKQEDERKRKEEEQRKAEEESQRLEKEKRRIAEERRKFEEEQERAESERQAEEERKRKEIEARRKAEEDRSLKDAEAEDETKQSEPELSEYKPEIAKPPGKSPVAKIGALIVLAVLIVSGGIFMLKPNSHKCELASVYHYPEGYYRREAGKWIEYHNDRLYASFEQFDMDSDYIYLVDKSRNRMDTSRSPPEVHEFYVRLPVCGGDAQWSYSNPLSWTSMYRVKPENQ